MKKISIVFILMMCSILLFAHSPLLTVEDNGDGTIYVQGGFSNGATAAGVKLYLTDKATGQKIWEGEFPDVGELNLPIPSVPYTVTFDAGPGHIIVKEGPEPAGGFGSQAADASASGNEAPAEAAPAQKPVAAAGSVGWVPMDTVSAMPAVGPSFTAILALVLAVINSVLIVFLFKKQKR
ncbi:hypothetical protein E4O00_03175 [Treponema sp. OMZ 788]|uniref:hypothetical protein n=1 Tax=unclassified Treponema TaxID=2638727 RepID=UPI0020A5779E|nr:MULTISPECIES: hypothetical protein [unclassified Treponema]UTC61801.1 hypothetical protein E4O05_09740 [Treponema sp. OMZ 787]UTC65183.1 hypothetical protein E4O00_03175 [Treponema sp. OMZ 788]